jgi:basic membrane protein A
MKAVRQIICLMVVTAIVVLFGTGLKEGWGAGKKFKVAMVLFGKITDQGWNSMMYESVVNLKDKYNLQIEYSENVTPADAERVIRGYASRGFNLIVAHAQAYAKVTMGVAKDFPQVKFARCCYGGPQDLAENVNVYDVDAHETSFLAGMLAGLYTKNNKVGVTAALKIPDFNENINGFKQGVKAANPNARFIVTWVGSFEAPVKAKEATLAMIDNGVDVVFSLGNGTGLGTIQACKERNIPVVGIHRDKNKIAPGVVITSVVWRMEPIIERFIKDARKGTYGKLIYKVSLKEGGAELAPFHAYENKVSAEIKSRLAKAKQDILSGKIKVKFDQKPPK